MRLISGILDILIILQDKTLFCAFEAVILSADWSIRGLQSWTCSRLPIFAEFVKLKQSIVIDIQRQSADLYKVQLCNRRHFSIDCLGGYRHSRFDFRVDKNCWEPAEYRPVWVVFMFEHHFCRFPRFFSQKRQLDKKMKYQKD